jgi:aldehyde dehydrogenase (NAD+)
METADLKLAVPAIVFGAVGTAGQRCTSTRRLFLHESIADDVIATLVEAYKQVPIGDPLDEGTLMGPLTDAGRRRSLHGRTRSSEGRGRRGTDRRQAQLDRDGYFVEPAIIAPRTTGTSSRKRPSRRSST